MFDSLDEQMKKDTDKESTQAADAAVGNDYCRFDPGVRWTVFRRAAGRLKAAASRTAPIIAS